MPEKYVYRVLRQDLATANLQLEAKVDEGFEVMEIGIASGAAGLVATLIIGNEVMTGIPCDDGAENLVPVEGIQTNSHPLIKTIKSKFPDVPLYKVSSGEILTITSGGAAGIAYLFYRQLSGAEIPAKSAAGASEGTSRLIIQHGKNLTSVGAGLTVDLIIATPLNPAGLPNFPFGELVPVNTEWDLLGFACQAGAGCGANTTIGGIRLWKNQESILVREQGILLPTLFPYPDAAIDKPIFLFPKPITFIGQEELKIEARATNAGGGAQNAEVIFTVIFVERFTK